MPDGTIFEYEIPKSDFTDKAISRQFNGLFANLGVIPQKDNSDLRSANIDYEDKPNVLSRNLKNGAGLCSIIEDRVEENSEGSLMMDKPIRTLRDIYQGIRDDIKEKRNKIKQKQKIVSDFNSKLHTL